MYGIEHNGKPKELDRWVGSKMDRWVRLVWCLGDAFLEKGPGETVLIVSVVETNPAGKKVTHKEA